MDIVRLLHQVESLREEAVSMRREYHKYAESSWLEFSTTARIALNIRQNNPLFICYFIGENTPVFYLHKVAYK